MSKFYSIIIIFICIAGLFLIFGNGVLGDSLYVGGIQSDPPHVIVPGGPGGGIPSQVTIPYVQTGPVSPILKTTVSEITQTPTPTIEPTISPKETNGASYAPNRLIVRYQLDQVSSLGGIKAISAETNAAIGATILADESTLGVSGLQIVGLPDNVDVETAISLYEKNPYVAYAEPDYVVQAIEMPVGSVSGVISGLSVNQGSLSNSIPRQVPTSGSGLVVPDVIIPDRSHMQVVSSPLISSDLTDLNTSCVTCQQGTEETIVGFSSNLTEEERYALAQAEVDEMNAYIQENNLSWTAGVNPIMLMTQEERDHLNGLKHREPDTGTTEDGDSIVPITGLPTSFDWRNNGGDFSTPVKNQGSCGSCWAFATTGAFESYKEIKSGNPGLNPNYAEQYLVSCASDQYGCNGGYFDSMAYFVNQAGATGGVGTVTETNYPYTATTGTCKSLSGYTRYTVDTSVGETWDYVGSGEWSIPSVDQIKTAIYTYGPVVAGVYVDSYFNGYSSGILDSTTYSSYTNHAIIIVGWGESNGRTYWICKNSWGTSWGESGWFRIYAGRLRIGEGAAYFKYSTGSPSTGSISASSTPTGADIWLDGSDSGQNTPSTLSSIATGDHSIRLVKSGYQDYTTTVSVTEGQTATVTATLSAESGGGGGTPVTPNDPSFSSLWGLHNTGQTGGTADADIDAPEAWAYSTGSTNIIVAVIDTGVDSGHPDLSGRVLTGYNFITNTPGQNDDNGHGTHCAGTIGGIGNNGIGVVGVNWNVKILPLKFLDSSGSGWTSDAIEAILYANQQGVDVISNSWGGGGYSQSLKDAIDASQAVVVCAAGNNGVNTDYSPQYPSAYTSSNIISVAATDHRDSLAYFSNYGAVSVDVAAPGVNIYSTYPTSKGSYTTMSGTSMATPHVAGLAALLKATNPDLTSAEIKNTILNSVDVKSSLSGKCLTGGRINAYKAIQAVYVPSLEAKFYGVPGVNVRPLTIQFHDASVGDPTSWAWNFGDGGSSIQQNPSHTYSSAGTYTVTLTISDGRSTSSTIQDGSGSIQGGV